MSELEAVLSLRISVFLTHALSLSLSLLPPPSSHRSSRPSLGCLPPPPPSLPHSLHRLRPREGESDERPRLGKGVGTHVRGPVPGPGHWHRARESALSSDPRGESQSPHRTSLSPSFLIPLSLSLSLPSNEIINFFSPRYLSFIL